MRRLLETLDVDEGDFEPSRHSYVRIRSLFRVADICATLERIDGACASAGAKLLAVDLDGPDDGTRPDRIVTLFHAD